MLGKALHARAWKRGSGPLPCASAGDPDPRRLVHIGPRYGGVPGAIAQAAGAAIDSARWSIRPCTAAGTGLHRLDAGAERIGARQPGGTPLRVMSADCHMDLFYLPPDAFTSRMDAGRWGDGIPRVVERDGTKVWVSAGAMLSPWGVYGPGVGAGKRGRILVQEGFAAGRARTSDPIADRSS